MSNQFIHLPLAPPSVPTAAQLPPVGSPGEVFIASDTGIIYGWSTNSMTWVEAGGGVPSAIISINGNTTAAQLIVGGTGINVSSTGGTTTITNTATVSNLVTVVTVSSSISPTTTNSSTYYNCNTSGGAFNFQLPTPSTGIRFKIKDSTGSFFTNNLTILRAGSELIENVAASFIMRTNDAAIEIYSDGTNWFII